MRTKKKILVVLGGNSKERKVSLDSGKSCISALNKMNYKSIKLVKGEAKTIGWTGKNWACNQLSKYANGDFLLFVDADTKLQKNTIAETVNEMNNNDIDLISLFPNRITKPIVINTNPIESSMEL